MNIPFFRSVSILASTIIGAGIFSLPYVFAQVGWGFGILYLSFFTLVYIALHRMYAELLFNSGGAYHFFYLTRKHLSTTLSRIASFVFMSSLVLTLGVYLTLAPLFFEFAFGVGGIVVVVVFWIVGSSFMFFGIWGQGWVDMIGLGAIFVIIGMVFFGGTGDISVPMFLPLSISSVFAPFGALLFSLVGQVAVFEVVQDYIKNNRSFSISLVLSLGTIVPAFLYLAFIIGVLRMGEVSSSDLFSSFSFSPAFSMLFGVMGLFTILTTYFMIGKNLQGILRTDMNRSVFVSGFIPVVFPILLYLLGLRNFLSLVSLSGGVFISLVGIFVVMMWRKAFPLHPLRFAGLTLYLVFGSACLYTVVSFFV
jgi:tyrosine-specific transport protein